MVSLEVLAIICAAAATSSAANNHCRTVANPLGPVDVLDTLGKQFGLVPASMPGIYALKPPVPLTFSGRIEEIRNNTAWCGKTKPFVVGQMRSNSVAQARLNLTAFGVKEDGVLTAAVHLRELDYGFVAWKSSVIASRNAGGVDVVFYRDTDKTSCIYWCGSNAWKDPDAERQRQVTFALNFIAVRESCEFADQPWSVNETAWFKDVVFGGSP